MNSNHRFYLSCLSITLILASFITCSQLNNKRHAPNMEPRLAVPNSPSHKKQFEAFGKKVMIVSEGKYSTQAGIDILRKGGNIFDAAVATSFTISVERPQSTGIGGGGFMLIKRKGFPAEALDFRERAPKRATSKMFLDAGGNVVPHLSTDGVMSIGVPGLVAGLIEIHEKYGRLKLEEVMKPAIELAEKGFLVYPELSEALTGRALVLERYRGSKKVFFKSESSTWHVLQTGDHLVQKDLCKSLRAISLHGRSGFYRGWVAKEILKTEAKEKGLLTQEDLDDYDVIYRKQVEGTFKDFRIVSMPPPSSGGAHILEILNILEKDGLKDFGVQSAHTVHLISAATQRAFADRAKFMGDPDFVPVPTTDIISKERAEKIRKTIPNEKAVPSIEIQPLPVLGKEFGAILESENTTHLTLQDSDGNVISSTQTINGWFGSGIVAENTGVLLNNEMDDFSAKVGASNLYGAIGGIPNEIAPGKRPLSSMSPTLVFRDEEPVLALGSPGGTRIISCVLQTLLNYLEFRLPLYESVAALRYHHQWQPDEIRMEKPFLPPATLSELEKMGYHLSREGVNCRVNAIALENSILHGVADPRGMGIAQGEMQ